MPRTGASEGSQCPQTPPDGPRRYRLFALVRGSPPDSRRPPQTASPERFRGTEGRCVQRELLAHSSPPLKFGGSNRQVIEGYLLVSGGSRRSGLQAEELARGTAQRVADGGECVEADRPSVAVLEDGQVHDGDPDAGGQF